MPGLWSDEFIQRSDVENFSNLALWVRMTVPPIQSLLLGMSPFHCDLLIPGNQLNSCSLSPKEWLSWNGNERAGNGQSHWDMAVLHLHLSLVLPVVASLDHQRTDLDFWTPMAITMAPCLFL